MRCVGAGSVGTRLATSASNSLAAASLVCRKARVACLHPHAGCNVPSRGCGPGAEPGQCIVDGGFGDGALRDVDQPARAAFFRAVKPGDATRARGP